MVEVPLETLVHEADYIYSGRITQVGTFKKELSLSHYGVYTLATLQVDATIKGEQKNTVDIFTIGGKIDGKDYRLSVAPEYFEGEDVVVFLKIERDGSIRTLHHAQGKKTFTNKVAKDTFIQEIETILKPVNE